METTHPPPKPYKLRQNRVQKAPNIRKRKKHPLYPEHENQHQLESNKQTQPSIKHSSVVVQAPPRINMAFPAPSVMPQRNPPMNTSKNKQTTLENYKNWNRSQGTHTQHATKKPQTTQYPKTQHDSSEKIEYRYPSIKAFTFNTRDMHNTILDLQHIMNTRKPQQ